MHCHACGSQVPDDVKFCTICGASFTDELDREQTLSAPIVDVQSVSETDPFAEEMVDAANDLPQDDPFFITPAQEEAPNDDWMDPKSPDFDPRKFAGLSLEEFQPLVTAVETEDELEPAELPKKERKKGKRGGIAVLIVALILVLLAGAAGALYWLTMPIKDAVAQNDLANYLALSADESVSEFAVQTRETSRLQRRDTLWCSVTVDDPGTRSARSYVMNYTLTREGWVLAAVDALDAEAWTVVPLSGASEEEVAQALIGSKIAFDDTYRCTLKEEDVASVQILDRNTDLDLCLDVLTISIEVVDDLVAWTTEAELELIFEDSWIYGDLRPEVPIFEFKPGMAFDLTEEDFLAVLAANPIPFAQSADDVTATVVADGEAQPAAASAAQTIKIDKDAVSELTVTRTAFDMVDDAYTAVLSFKLDKQVAKLSVEAALTFVFDDGWKIDTITYVPTVEEVVLDGEWKGTYTESEGRVPGVTLTIAENEDGTDNNVFAFGPSEQSPYFFTGKYYVTDEADPKTLAVSLKATDWVLYYNPGGVALVSLEGGFLMIDEAKITDGSTFTLALQRTVIETETEEAPDESLIAKTVETAEIIVLNGPEIQFGEPDPDEAAEEEETETETETEAETEAEVETVPEAQPEETVTDTTTETVETTAPDTTEPDTTEPETTAPDTTVDTDTPADPEVPTGDPNDPFLGPNDTPIF